MGSLGPQNGPLTIYFGLGWCQGGGGGVLSEGMKG